MRRQSTIRATRTAFGLAAVLFLFCAATVNRGAAQVLTVDCLDGIWTLLEGTDQAANPGSSSGIPCTEPLPGWRISEVDNWTVLWISGNAASSSGHPPFSHHVDANNRVVRSDDGNCYRERRIDGAWLRSAPYGSSAADCRRAVWNAHYRSQSEPAIEPTNEDSTPEEDS